MTTLIQTSARSNDGLWVLFAVCLAALTLPLSFSGGAIATPAIGKALGGSAASLAWITNSFMLTFGSLLMAAGTLADQFGRRKVFTVGIGLFVVFSFASSFAASVVAIDFFRAAQGVGAAAALAGGSASIAQEFEGHARTKAFSMLGTTFGIGLAFGPVIMGMLTQQFGWQSVFVTSGVVGVVAIVLGVPRMRETRDPDAADLDWAGVFSFTTMLSLFTFAVIEAPTFGWTSPLIVSLFSGSLVMLITFVGIEAFAVRPMLDLSLFQYPRFVGVQLLPVATCYSYVVLLILLPLRFVGVEGMGERDAGVLMLAFSAPMLFVPYIAAHLARYIAPGLLSAIGLLIAALGVLWLGHSAPGSGVSTMAPFITAVPIMLPLFVIGFGAALPWGLMDGLSVSVVPKERAGMASGIFNTSKVANEGIALASVSAVLAILTAKGLPMIAAKDSPNSHNALEAAQYLASGNLSHAMAMLPGLAKEVFVESYFIAFQNVTLMLALVTGAIAIFIFCLMPKRIEGDERTI